MKYIIGAAEITKVDDYIHIHNIRDNKSRDIHIPSDLLYLGLAICRKKTPIFPPYKPTDYGLYSIATVTINGRIIKCTVMCNTMMSITQYDGGYVSTYFVSEKNIDQLMAIIEEQ